MNLPFSASKLDGLMDQAGVDVVLATSRENVQYLLGGYRYCLFAHKDPISVSRYTPCVGYVKGHPEKALYVGCPGEPSQQELEPAFWIKNVRNISWQSEKTGTEAAAFIRSLGFARGVVGVEMSFLPADCLAALQSEVPEVGLIEAHPILDELRAVKRPDELAMLKEASELITDSLLTVMRATKAGTTTGEIAEQLRREEVNRGLNFEYCLVATGPSYSRVPSEDRWEQGNILSLDSGGNKNGYLGDLCRMAVLGAPTPLMTELLAEVLAVQAAARTAVKARATGSEIFASALAEQSKCPHRGQMIFVAHGMGMIQHEAPHLTSTGPIPYPAVYKDQPLEAGMVLSIATDLRNPEVGLVKVEDTVVITPESYEAFGDIGRDWNCADG